MSLIHSATVEPQTPAAAPAVPGQPLVDALARCELLRSFSPGERAAFAAYLNPLAAEPGTNVVTEGELSVEMYFLLEGSVRIAREQLVLRSMHAGDVFGEIGLVSERPRVATVTAMTRLWLARLSRPDYQRMLADSPALANRFLQHLVALVGGELISMTENVRLLLNERSLLRRTVIEVRRDELIEEIPTGSQLKDLVPAWHQGARVVAALVDRKAVSLSTRLFASATLEPLTTAHWEGQEIFRRSAGLALLEAGHQMVPALVLRLGAVRGANQEIELETAGDVTALAAALNAALEQLVAADRPFREEQWAVEEARHHFLENGWQDAARQLHIWRLATVPLVSCGAVYTPSMGPVLPSTGELKEVRVLADNGTLLLHLGEELGRHLPRPKAELEGALDRRLPPPPDDGDMVRDHRAWLERMGVTGVGAFNDLCVSGGVNQLIRVCESFHEKRLGRLADLIAARREAVRVICVAGPSSSGKTTFIKRMSVQLQVNGVRPVELSLDDYYMDREKTVRDAQGEYDFEALEAIDVTLLRQHLSRLLSGERVRIARYDFLQGRSHPEGGPELELSPDSVLMLEGVHGLNPALLGEEVPPSAVFRVFLHPAITLRFDRLARVSTADLRLLRRIVRDRHSRGHDAANSIRRWPSVRRGERLHIFPFMPHAHAVFDSSLVYEMSVLKVYADRYLLEVPPDHPSFTTAHRLRALLDSFVSIYPDQVPPTSLLREFIGGSGFKY